MQELQAILSKITSKQRIQEEQSLQCKYCDKEYDNTSSLSSHIQRHHKDGIAQLRKGNSALQRKLDEQITMNMKLQEVLKAQNNEIDNQKMKLKSLHSSLDKLLGVKRKFRLQVQENIAVSFNKKPNDYKAYNVDLTDGNQVSKLLSKLGGQNVGAIHIDPPWEGTSCTKKLYNCLTDQQIKEIPIGEIHKKGYIFLWVIKSKVSVGLELLKHWGYQYKDMITWVKVDDLSQLNGRVGFHLDHATEFCLVGRKGKVSEMGKVQNLGLMQDVIVSKPIKPSSTKPKEIYEIIERVIEDAHYVDIFGREHCLRRGWITVGNQLPPAICDSLNVKTEEEIERDKRQERDRVIADGVEQKKEVLIGKRKILELNKFYRRKKV